MATVDPKSKKGNRFLRALRSARPMSPEERIQMLADIGLMKQEDADKAKLRYQKR